MPKYTARHYRDIGDTLRRSKASPKLVGEWIAKFKADNPRFDEGRFKKYLRYEVKR